MANSNANCCVHQGQVVVLKARVRGAEVLSRHLEETQLENDQLRTQLGEADTLLARVLNQLEVLQAQYAQASQPIPQAARPVMESLLEENQRLKQEVMFLRMQAAVRCRLGKATLSLQCLVLFSKISPEQIKSRVGRSMQCCGD